MIIHTQISWTQYRNLLFGLAYGKPLMKLLLALAALTICWIADYYLHIWPVPKPVIYQYITIVLILIVQPLVIYLTVKRNYDSSNHLREPLVIELNEEVLKMRGTSFFTEVAWDKIYKVVEQKNWVLIYLNTLSAVIIPKKDFKEGQLERFSRFAAPLRETKK